MTGELSRELLMLEDGFGAAGALRLLMKSAPGSQARTVQIDDGNLAIGRLEALVVNRIRHLSKSRLETVQPGLEKRRHHCLHNENSWTVLKELSAPFYRTAGTIGLHRQHSGVV